MDWAAFQAFVKAIQEDLVPGFVLEDVEFEADSLDIERQLDAVIRNKDGPYTVRILVEATTRAAKVDLADIDAFAKKAERLNCQKMVVVSATGFTGPALSAAKGEGVETWVLRQVREEDVAGTIGKVGVKLRISKPEARDFQMGIKAPVPGRLERPFTLLDRDYLFVYDAEGQLTGNVWDFVQANCNTDGTHSYAMKEGHHFYLEGRRVAVNKFAFTVQSKTWEEELLIDGEADLVAVYENAQDPSQRRFIHLKPGQPAVFLPLAQVENPA